MNQVFPILSLTYQVRQYDTQHKVQQVSEPSSFEQDVKPKARHSVATVNKFVFFIFSFLIINIDTLRNY